MLISEQEYHTPRPKDGACSLGKKGFGVIDFLLNRLIFWQFGKFFIPLIWVMARGRNMLRPEVGLRVLLSAVE